MLNIEKYKEVIFELIEECSLGCAVQTVRAKNKECGGLLCNECNKINMKWLLEEYKEPVKLTIAEKCILENLKGNFEWIVRDENGVLYLCEEKPKKHYGDKVWVDGFNYHIIRIFEHLFKFIKWEDEEPYNIKELLENCEVV